jgi:hypothetical protein
LRGKHGSDNRDAEFAIAELYGGIKQTIIYFAAETGTSAEWVAARISALLSPQRQGVFDQLPTVQRETSFTRGTLEPLALAQYAHSSETPSSIAAGSGSSYQTDHPEIKQPGKRGPKPGGIAGARQKSYWAAMTKEQRREEMLRRMKKHKNLSPKELTIMKSLKAAVRAEKAASNVKPTGGAGKKRNVDQSKIQKEAWARKKAAQAGQLVVDPKLEKKRKADAERHRLTRDAAERALQQAQQPQQVQQPTNEIVMQ